MRSLRLAAGALLVLGAGCGMFPASPAPRAALLPRADADFSRSLAHFAHGLILDAELGPAGDAAAIGAFRQAAALDATNALLTHLIAGRLWSQGEHEAALAEVQRQIRRDDSGANHALLASLADAAGRHALAAEHYGQAADRQADGGREWRALQARAWIRAGEDRRALRVLRRLARPRGRADGDFALPFMWGRHLLRVQPDAPRARPYFELALQCATTAVQRAAAHEALASTALAAGDTNGARRAVFRAVREAPGDPERILNLVRFELAVTGPAATSAWLRAAAARRPDPVALLALAQVAGARRDFAAACHYAGAARQALERDGAVPLAAAFYTLHANFLDEAGRKTEAEQMLLEALTEHPDSAMLQNHLAYFWAVENRRLEEAETLVARALAQQPENGAFLDTLGWVYYRQGRYDEALRQLALAIRSEGDDPAILDHLGDVYLALGRLEEALFFWRRSLRRAPDNASVAEKLRRHAAPETK